MSLRGGQLPDGLRLLAQIQLLCLAQLRFCKLKINTDQISIVSA